MHLPDRLVAILESASAIIVLLTCDAALWHVILTLMSVMRGAHSVICSDARQE